MKNATMIVFLVFSMAILGISTAFAGSEYNSSMMGGGTGTMFQHPQRLSTVIGSEVTNKAGQNLGKVRDLIANEDGRISYLIVARGGGMGNEADLVAIPTSAVEPTTTMNGKVSINLDKESLEKAPTFAASDYPQFSNKNWQDKVRGYFPTMGHQPATGEQMVSAPLNTVQERNIAIGGGAN